MSQNEQSGPLTKTRPRFEYLDNIKWTLAVLVVLHHAAAVAGLDPFPINLPKVPQAHQWQYEALGRFQGVNQGFFMSLFFFISAYFVLPSLARKGAGPYMLGKLSRLGIPVLLTVAFISPTTYWLAGDQDLTASLFTTFGMYANAWRHWNLILGVTWFCWSLIVFNACYVLFRLTRGATGVQKRPAPLPRASAVAVFALAMIPLNYLGQYAQHRLGQNFLGFHLLQFFPMYIVMFWAGIQAWKRGWIEQLTWRHGFAGFVVWAVAATFLSRETMLVCRPFSVLGMSVFLLVAFGNLFNNTGPWRKRLSRSAYAAYVVQVLPLTLTGKLLLPHMTPWPLLNFVMVAVVSVPAAFVLGYGLTRLPLLRRVL